MNRDFWRGRRVFVTGHSGFKGRWLTRWLDSLGATVSGFSLPDDDVRNLEGLRSSVEKAEPEIVFHLAAQALVRSSYEDPVTTFATNLMGSVNMVESLRGMPGVGVAVLVTSDKCYFNSGDGHAFREDDRLGGSDPYSGSKACAELAIQAYRQSFFTSASPRLISARAGNVIGGGDSSRDRLVPDLVRAFREGRPASLRFLDSTRPWQFVLDALHGYLLAAERGFGGDEIPDSFNFGPAEEQARTVRWLADRMAEAWGGSASWTLSGEAEPYEAPTLALDSGRARRFLGWTPLLDSESAVTWTAEWYKSERDLTAEQIGRFMDMLPK